MSKNTNPHTHHVHKSILNIPCILFWKYFIELREKKINLIKINRFLCCGVLSNRLPASHFPYVPTLRLYIHTYMLKKVHILYKWIQNIVYAECWCSDWTLYSIGNGKRIEKPFKYFINSAYNMKVCIYLPGGERAHVPWEIINFVLMSSSVMRWST